MRRQTSIFWNAWLFAIVLSMWSVPLRTEGSATFSDSTFNDNDWFIQFVTAGNGGSGSASQVLIGGNPGPFRQVTLSLNDVSTVYAFNGRSDAVYDPATQGAIASIDYSEEGIIASGGAQGAHPALLQGGTVFFYQVGYNPTASWTPYSVSNLTSNDFVAVLANGNPDFSATAPPITFGFARANATAGGGGFITNNGIDNWNVVVHPVPEPASLSFAALGGTTLLMRHRRRLQRRHS